MSPEVKVVLRLIASFGASASEIAGALVTTHFDYKRTAILVGIREPALRQRCHRLQARVRGILPSFETPIRPRAKIRLGAGGRGDEAGNLYARSAAETISPLDELILKEEARIGA